MYVLPPENLRAELDKLYHQAYIHQRTWRWSAAVETYKTIYEILIDNQPQGNRFHKGASLHLLGIALLYVQEFMFSVGLDFQSDLEQRATSPKLRREFEKHKIILSANGSIVTKVKDDQWQIDDSDNNSSYIVIKEGETLRIYVRETSSAIKNFLLAYTEDVLSKSPGEEDRADEKPAGLVLKLHFEIRPNLLEVIKKLARGAKEAKQIVQNPTAILAKALAQVGADEQQITELCGAIPEIGPKRSLDEPRSPWEYRVFIGGNYNQLLPLETIKEAVAQPGYDPILAADFEMPEDLIYHHTLMLLHSCKLAIFDISQGNGHLMEIERAFDYGISPLFVYSVMEPRMTPRVSVMLTTRLGQSGYEPQPYRTSDDLWKLVRKYLEEKGLPLATRSYTETTTTITTEISNKVTTSLSSWAEEASNEP